MSQEAKKTDVSSLVVVYVCDRKLFNECDEIPNIRGRANLVHNLIKAYGLLSHMQLVPPKLASEDSLLSFHSRHYIEFLQKVNESSDLEKYEEDQLEFGLGYDCPLIEGIYRFVETIAGASITAAQVLVNGMARVAINWCGGWHHAQSTDVDRTMKDLSTEGASLNQKIFEENYGLCNTIRQHDRNATLLDEAEGFCYINDVVLAIHKLREKFNRVLYIDFDLHHGNGVENAFAFTPHVLTLSLHKYEPGFYPGSGKLLDVGFGQGRYYTVNVPLKDGVRDDNYVTLFHCIANKIWSAYCPNAVVVQCGADCINGDPACAFNLTPQGIGLCIKKILAWNLPTLFLGGGGYNLPVTARCWTYLTSIIVGCQISSSIPDSNVDFLCYSPDFELDVIPGNRSDLNTAEDMKELAETICKFFNGTLFEACKLSSEESCDNSVAISCIYTITDLPFCSLCYRKS